MSPSLVLLPAQGGNDLHFQKSGFGAQISQINLTDLRNPSDLTGLTGLTGRISLIDLIDLGGVSSSSGLSTPRCVQVHVPEIAAGAQVDTPKRIISTPPLQFRKVPAAYGASSAAAVAIPLIPPPTTMTRGAAERGARSLCDMGISTTRSMDPGGDRQGPRLVPALRLWQTI